MSINRRWVNSQLEHLLPSLLQQGGAEEYRRTAELLTELKSRVLPTVLAQAARQPDPEIREVATDFGQESERTEPPPQLQSESLGHLIALRAAGGPLWETILSQLKPDERDVLDLLSEGLSFEQIATRSNRSRRDIEQIVQRILQTIFSVVRFQ